MIAIQAINDPIADTPNRLVPWGVGRYDAATTAVVAVAGGRPPPRRGLGAPVGRRLGVSPSGDAVDPSVEAR